MHVRCCSLALLALAAIPARPADFVFGRRVYAAEGRTFQQIWTLDAHLKKSWPLTNSDRRHAQPVATADGKRIWFFSGPFGDETNNELWWFEPQSKAEKQVLQFNGRLVALVGVTRTAAFFAAYNEDQAALYRWDGKLTKLGTVGPAVQTAAALSPNARVLAVQTGEAASVTMMETAGAKGRTIPNCAAPVWSPDSAQLACNNGRTVRVLNVATGVDAFHAEFVERPTEPAAAAFSPDGKRLLVRTIGASHSTTSPQSDYWVLDLATAKWAFVGPGQAAVFDTPDQVLLVTPRELGAVTVAKKDWVAHILLVDIAAHSQAPLTTGITSNVEPSRCPHLGPIAAGPAPAPAPLRK